MALKLGDWRLRHRMRKVRGGFLFLFFEWYAFCIISSLVVRCLNTSVLHRFCIHFKHYSRGPEFEIYPLQYVIVLTCKSHHWVYKIRQDFYLTDLIGSLRFETIAMFCIPWITRVLVLKNILEATMSISFNGANIYTLGRILVHNRYRIHVSSLTIDIFFPLQRGSIFFSGRMLVPCLVTALELEGHENVNILNCKEVPMMATNNCCGCNLYDLRYNLYMFINLINVHFPVLWLP